jgi:DNA relaxase NicK
MNPRFDAYTATGTGFKPHDVMPLLVDGVSGVKLTEGKGFHHFGERLAVADDFGQFAAVQWGGAHGERVMIEVKGERTPQVVDGLRQRFEHRCTRVDSAVDFEQPGAWESLLAPVMQAKDDFRLYGEPRGDWRDFPEKGRTQYLGAKSSVVQARLYEKGKQAEYAHLARTDWVRLELQVRPEKDAKQRYAALSASEVWGASPWTRQLAASVLELHLAEQPAGTVWRRTQRDQALAWMVRQYGAHLVSLAEDLGGWRELGQTLAEMIEEQRLEAKR